MSLCPQGNPFPGIKRDKNLPGHGSSVSSWISQGCVKWRLLWSVFEMVLLRSLSYTVRDWKSRNWQLRRKLPIRRCDSQFHQNCKWNTEQDLWYVV